MLETHDDFSELQPLTSEFGDDLDGPKLRTLLTFVLGQQIFAVDVGFVREVLDNREVRPFPGAPFLQFPIRTIAPSRNIVFVFNF